MTKIGYTLWTEAHEGGGVNLVKPTKDYRGAVDWRNIWDSLGMTWQTVSRGMKLETWPAGGSLISSFCVKVGP